jgi:hypothetical protein
LIERPVTAKEKHVFNIYGREDFFFKRFDRGNCNCSGVIVPKEKREKMTGYKEARRSENEPCLFRIKYAPGGI